MTLKGALHMKYKQYLQQGFCEALHYTSLNHVLYGSEAEGLPYNKIRMNCTACKDGRCDRENICQLLVDAPAQLEYSDWHLRDM